MNGSNPRLARLRDFALLAIGTVALMIGALLAYAEIRFEGVMDLYVTTRGGLYATLLLAIGVLCAGAFVACRPPAPPDR